MKASYHVVASGVVAASFHALAHSWPATTACFLSGILIDVDHYWEYYLVRKKMPCSYQDLVDFCFYDKHSKLYLIFHSYEYLVLFWLAITVLDLGLVFQGIALGATVHLLFDQFTNPIKPLYYFLTYRIIHGFDKKRTLSQKYFEINHSRD